MVTSALVKIVTTTSKLIGGVLNKLVEIAPIVVDRLGHTESNPPRLILSSTAEKEEPYVISLTPTQAKTVAEILSKRE